MNSPDDSPPVVEMELSDLPPLPPPSSYVPSPSPPSPTTLPPKRRFSLLPSEYQRLIYKATPRSVQPLPVHPVNELTKLLTGLSSSENSQQELVAIAMYLQSRLSNPAWTVQLKSQVLVHHILRRAPQSFIEHLSQTLHDTFKQRALTPSTIPIRAFVASYDAYLERRAALLATFHFPPAFADEREAALALYFIKTSSQTVFQVIPFLMRVVDSLIAVQMVLIADCTVAIPAFTMLKRDLAVFCVVLSPAIKRVVQLFNLVDKREKAAALRLIMNYTALVGRVKRFSVDATEIPTKTPGPWPELSSVGGDVLRNMRKEVDWK